MLLGKINKPIDQTIGGSVWPAEGAVYYTSAKSNCCPRLPRDVQCIDSLVVR